MGLNGLLSAPMPFYIYNSNQVAVGKYYSGPTGNRQMAASHWQTTGSSAISQGRCHSITASEGESGNRKRRDDRHNLHSALNTVGRPGTGR